MRTVAVVVLLFSVIYGATSVTWATSSDQQYETALRERKRDFDKFVRARKKSSASELAAAERLREQRRVEMEKRRALERSYQKISPRYSMEESAARDRADEQRLEILESKAKPFAKKFVRDRDRQSEIESRVQPVDPYEEYEIDMKKEPASKASHMGMVAEPASNF